MKQKEVVGAFVRVPIDDTLHTYGRILNDHKYAFYDFRTNSESSNIDEIERASILFKVLVHRAAVTKGFWKIVGIKELTEDLKKPVPLFIQEIGDYRNCTIDLEGVRIQVSPEECIGVERFAAWEHHHVEKRLLDFYNGVPNKYLLSLDVKL